jgi:hypothetical protein
VIRSGRGQCEGGAYLLGVVGGEDEGFGRGESLLHLLGVVLPLDAHPPVRALRGHRGLATTTRHVRNHRWDTLTHTHTHTHTHKHARTHMQTRTYVRARTHTEKDFTL